MSKLASISNASINLYNYKYPKRYYEQRIPSDDIIISKKCRNIAGAIDYKQPITWITILIWRNFLFWIASAILRCDKKERTCKAEKIVEDRAYKSEENY
ncbi:hypothetical protein, conserved [Plasmodium berghei]|uniref:Uncharacterized protein n=1 Tax=Plasmodium berghei TaxID=5821 RepID=A0A0Y9PRR4_PLABE|nr:hypothetical protein, conserved [Plasmodium berghei]CXH21359.1 hypothetical protein, conserved [Plasmodium berghei]SCL82041.1 hypothetical protein, conserved [Plasmodium berghei]SCL84145.1 hypothetical protein PBNK65NY_000502600 [Plasmodium berghei]